MPRTITRTAICGLMAVACTGEVAGGIGTRSGAVEAQSPAEENEALIRRGFEMVNEIARHAQEHPADLAGLRERQQALVDLHAYGAGYFYTGPGGEGILWESDAFPDRSFTIEALVACDDWVVTRYTFRATHRGDVAGIAATGKRVTLSGMLMQRIEDGRVVEDRDEWDRLSLLEQLGATP